MHDDKALIGPRRRNGLAINPLRFLREPQQEIRRILYFRRRGAERFALLLRHCAGEVILALDHQLPGAVQNGRAVVCRRGGPGGKGFVGGIDGARGLFAAAVRNFLDNVAVGRVGDLEHSAGPGFGPFACN